MAAASIPTTSGIETNCMRNKQEENARQPTVEELLIQIENHLYKSIEHRASLLIAVWSCLAGKASYFRNLEKVFHMLYRESAMTIFSGHWPKINLLFKRGLSRALIHFSHSMGHFIKRAEGLCSALVMAAYDPWGDPIIHKLISKADIDQNLVNDFIKSEPFELLVIRIECLVNARFEEAAIRLCRCCLKSHLFQRNNEDEDKTFEENCRWTFMEWLLRLLFRKGRLNDLVAESGACSCHDGVRLIYRSRNSPFDDSEPLTETLINIFLVRDLLFQSNYCCTSELMSLWCDFQVHKQRSASEIQDAAHKLLVGHASSSAQFYLFVDILWGKFGASLLPLYIEMYIRGLTSDLNYLEAARQAEKKEFVIEIENHMAAMYFKLSSMFHNINKEISLECMLSSFSLDPTKERLDWIKKLSLQISKEKALKMASAKNESCKHKLCNKTGCTYLHPVIPKKKPVIMCDQAIQVGDDSFENEVDTLTGIASSINNTNKIDDSAVSTAAGLENNSNSNQLPEKTSDGSNEKENELNPKNHVEQNSHSNSSENNCGANNCDLVINSETHPDKPQLVKTPDKVIESESPSELNTSEIKEIICKTNEKNPSESNLIKCEKNCHSELTEKNYVPHNGEICKVSEKTADLALNDSKNSGQENDNKSLSSSNKEKSEHVLIKSNKSDKCREINMNNHEVNENGFVSQNESENSMSPVSSSKKKSEHLDQHSSKVDNDVGDDIAINNVLVNGCGSIEDSTPSEKTNIDQPANSCEKISESNENANDNTVNETDVINYVESNVENHLPIASCDDNENKNSEVTNTSSMNLENPLKDECLLNTYDAPPDITIIEEEVQNKHPFTHIVLDCKISGLSQELLSDFVIVLESLRNKQLKSSCKWSQIKHLCEDYLENVTHSRCMMLNMQMNGSVDSEADSSSEITAVRFKGFASHQSDESIVEDHYADKSHVFKRFMQSDKNAEMATYVNLSDIHCPQIPLEKLFCTESSSHVIRKKRHKKHRNHDKNPEKVALRKLRHGSRAERELVKRKKRKKRKGKRAKNHVKKHHFTHGKANKDCLKNKKKKHKLKKKKEERNSGFISGDYCSDFSSAELMRLVKEHSHSYSKLPATTSKHPHSIGSSSDEPNRKKRKVTFDKKKQKTGKYHDKHKHNKLKSSKRKKKLSAIESCPNAVKNITDRSLHGKIDSVNDYSRIVQYSSVKKMEAVQIRQRSVALNLSEVSKVSHEQDNQNAFVDPCTSNAQLQQLVQQNFESSEDIMKMQLLMAQQQPGVMPISTTNFMSSASNQAVLKYVCSKMTSHLLSVAQSSNSVPSDSEGSKSSTPTHSGRSPQTQRSKFQPQNLSSNVKHVIIERGAVPYKLSGNSSSLAGTIIPISSLPSIATSDSRSLMGTVFSGGITYPATATSPQVTTFTIPVAHNAPCSKLVTSKIVIPINQCGNMRAGTPTPIPLPEGDTRTLSNPTGNPSLSGVIIVKNGNNTQIISGVQQPSTVLPCLPTTRVVPFNRNRPSPIVSKTVPKIIKQAAKKLAQPIAKKSVFKPVLCPKPVTPLNAEALNDPVIASSLLATKEPEINKPQTCATSKDNVSKNDTSDSIISIKDSPVPEQDLKISTKLPDTLADSTSSPVQEEISVKSADKNVTSDQIIASSIENKDDVSTSAVSSPTPVIHSSAVKATSSDSDMLSKQPSAPSSPIDKEPVSSPRVLPEDSKAMKNDIETECVSSSEEETEKNKEPSTPEESEPVSSLNKVSSVSSETMAVTEKVKTPIHFDEKEDDVKSPSAVEKPKTSKNDTESTIARRVSIAPEENKTASQTNANDSSLKILTARRNDCTPIKAVNLTSGNQEKQLQPINDAEISNDKSSPKVSSQSKSEGGCQTSEAPTRSFTSISDAVRFSLMDMDDATDSVENQVVLQAYQSSRASSPASPTYAASDSGEERNSSSPASAVMLSAPQSTSTTELSVSRVSQRFEPVVHCSQSEKFTECQSTVSRTTTWILEDNITEASPSVTVQKSPDIDSCGEVKDEDKPKKKRKKKERVDNDSAHKFWCQICSKGFFSAYNLRRHCRNVHKMVLPKGSSDVPFANSSQCLPHVQQADTTTSETSSSRLSYGNVQTSCVSPNKGSEYSMLSPTHDAKNQEFSVKSGQHVPQRQSAEFQMQTPPRMASQSSSTHISPVTPPKEFCLGTPTSVSSPQISPNKMSPVKSSPQSKFQRMPSSSQSPQMAKISQMQQIALCGQQALQQQRQIGQLQSPGLIQPLPSVACQAQQIQASQCPHFQANKQIVQQRIGQLQLMHHVAQLPSVPHATHGIQKPTQNQSFKKCNTNQSTSKISENEQIQQAAQLAQNQQLLANQQMQKLIQMRQNAIAASGIASQLSLANAIPSVPGSPVKGATQCFQSQLAAARQAAVVSQIPTAQRAQGSGYNLPSHETSSHQFFPPSVQPSQDQASCPHSSFSAQNMSEFSANAPSYPTIRLTSEANDGLEDLEQFLLENMPWSGEQSSAHGLAQQSGNRPSSADSLTLSIPSQASASQNRGGVASKSKASISRPKPRKPVATPCSKNLLGNLGRGVKKKSCSKKNSKSSDTECAVLKPEVFPQSNLVQQPHELKQCNKDAMGNIPNYSKQIVKNSSVGILNETDSSDSVQCINVTHNTPLKNASVGINFNIFSPVGLCTSEKGTDLMCNPSCKEAYDGQRKNSFLDHSNLVGTSSNLDPNKNSINMNPCETTNPINMGSAFNPAGKSSTGTMKPFCATAPTPYGITNETPNPQDIFLGQRNSETSDSNISDQKNKNNDLISNVNASNSQNTHALATLAEKPPLQRSLFLGDSSRGSDEKLEPSNQQSNKETEQNAIADIETERDICNSDKQDVPESKEDTPCNSVEAGFSKTEESSLCPTKENNVSKTNDNTPCDSEKNVASETNEETSTNEILKDRDLLPEKVVPNDNNSQLDDLEEEKIKDEPEFDKKSHHVLDENSNSIVVNPISKENLSLSPNADDLKKDAVDDNSNIVIKTGAEEKSFVPKVVGHDEHSSHEDTIPNDENHLPKKNDLENISSEIGVNRIALRVRKPQDATNNKPLDDKIVPFFVVDKDDVKTQVIKKSSKKKKIKHENRKNENIIDAKISYKLDTDSKIQKTSLLNNVNKEKDLKRSLCMITSCYDGIKKTNSIPSEDNEESFCINEKQVEEASIDGIPAARLRLRDTPKTSVKRVCPCCVDSKMPKKCRANGGGNITKIISGKVSNNLKAKSTLKTRNTTNGHNGKVNTRSSQRLRSRNNAIS